MFACRTFEQSCPTDSFWPYIGFKRVVFFRFGRMIPLDTLDSYPFSWVHPTKQVIDLHLSCTSSDNTGRGGRGGRESRCDAQAPASHVGSYQDEQRKVYPRKSSDGHRLAQSGKRCTLLFLVGVTHSWIFLQDCHVSLC